MADDEDGTRERSGVNVLTTRIRLNLNEDRHERKDALSQTNPGLPYDRLHGQSTKISTCKVQLTSLRLRYGDLAVKFYTMPCSESCVARASIRVEMTAFEIFLPPPINPSLATVTREDLSQATSATYLARPPPTPSVRK